MTKRTIDDLCGTVSAALPMDKRYSGKQLDQYVADLERILELESQGKTRPTAPVIREYVATELGMVVGVTTIKDHLSKLQRKEALWAVK